MSEAHERSEGVTRDDCYGEASGCEGRRERAERSEPRERSEPAKRLARARVVECEGQSPSE
jgi:hypothetical protein